MSTSSLPAESGNNTTTNDEAAELLADVTHLQALEDSELARTVKLRAGVLERQVTEGDNEFALAMIQSVRRGLCEIEVRAVTGSPSRPRGSSAEDHPRDLLGEFCPACKSTEAWHPCLTEDDSTKFACDECGVTMAVKPAPKPKPAKVKRPFNFTFEIDKGRLFIDWRDDALLAFKPGRYLAIGGWELLSAAEAEEREENGCRRRSRGRGGVMIGDEPISAHVFIVTPTRRLWRRWRWQCSCGATEGGYITKTSAIFAGDNHAMRAA